MNLLNELPIGNAFKSSNDISFRCKGDIAPNFIPIMQIKQYFLINKDMAIYPICIVKDFTSGLQHGELTQIKNIPTGTICWTGNSFGLTQYLLITDIFKDNIMMVAALGETKLMNATSRMVDLGPVSEYAGPNISYDILKVCPNCANLSFKAEPDKNIDGILELSGKCYNCGCNIKITW